MTVTTDTAAAVLKMAASFDNRTVTQETVSAWSAALIDAVTIQDARTVISGYFQNATSGYLMPGHINEGIKKIRTARTARIGADEIPPDEIADDPIASIAWIRAYRRTIANGTTPEQARDITNHATGTTEQPKRVTARYDAGTDDTVMPHIARHAAAYNAHATRKKVTTSAPAPSIPTREEFMSQVEAMGIAAMPQDDAPTTHIPGS